MVDAIDPTLRRAGRFDSEVKVVVATVQERLLILKVVFDVIFHKLLFFSFSLLHKNSYN
jgi:ATP-dependent 26S proteasome regulatory subunit